MLNALLIWSSAKVALTTPASGQQKDLSSKKKSTKSGNNAEPTEGDQTGTDGNAKEQTNPGEDEEEEGESNQSDAEGPKDRGGLGLKGDAKVNKHQHDILSEDEVTISVNYSGGGQGLKKRMYNLFLFGTSHQLTVGHLSYSGRGLEHDEPTKGSPAIPFPGSQTACPHACCSHEVHFAEELLGIKGNGGFKTIAFRAKDGEPNIGGT